MHWNCFPGIATLWYCMMLCDVQLQVPLWVSQTAPGEIVVVTVEYYTFHFRSLSQSCRFSVNHCHFSSLPRSRIILACHPRAISTVTTILLLTGIVWISFSDWEGPIHGSMYIHCDQGVCWLKMQGSASPVMESEVRPWIYFRHLWNCYCLWWGTYTC